MGSATVRWLLLGLLIGGVIGAATALLFAPERGEETRRVVRSRAQPAVGRIRNMATRLARRNEAAPKESEDT